MWAIKGRGERGIINAVNKRLEQGGKKRGTAKVRGDKGRERGGIT